ncbi:MAG: glycerol acyltransferase, partial [Mangrovicoccus sp.]
MQDRIDPLIEERAPWLFSQRPWAGPSRFALTRMLSYSKTIRLAEHFEPQSTEEIMGAMGQMLAQDVEISGLENIPRQGAAMVVANHPTGIADGIILYHLLAK